MQNEQLFLAVRGGVKREVQGLLSSVSFNVVVLLLLLRYSFDGAVVVIERNVMVVVGFVRRDYDSGRWSFDLISRVDETLNR